MATSGNKVIRIQRNEDITTGLYMEAKMFHVVSLILGQGVSRGEKNLLQFFAEVWSGKPSRFIESANVEIKQVWMWRQRLGLREARFTTQLLKHGT